MKLDKIHEKYTFRIAVGIFTLTLLLAGSSSAATWTVDDSSGANYTRIQDAIDNAAAGDTIFVYNGIYYENIIINKKIILQGETKDATILQASHNTNAIRINNAENIIITNMTIKGGGDSRLNEGGGIQVIKSTFIIKNCLLTNNKAVNGAGISIESGSSGIISNCLIVDNFAANGAGGVIVRLNSKVTFLNDVVVNNSAGGLINEGTTEIKNSIFWNNGLIELNDRGYGTFKVSYSDINGGWPGIGNINKEPLFVNPAIGDFHLQAGSPSIDMGTIDGDGYGIEYVPMIPHPTVPKMSIIALTGISLSSLWFVMKKKK